MKKCDAQITYFSGWNWKFYYQKKKNCRGEYWFGLSSCSRPNGLHWGCGYLPRPNRPNQNEVISYRTSTTRNEVVYLAFQEIRREKGNSQIPKTGKFSRHDKELPFALSLN
jgi:hypothetical protein